VKQAYLRSKDDLTREIYLKPKPEDREYFGIDDGDLLLLKKPLYGVCDAGDYWGVTVAAHVEEDLGMTPLVGDPSLYVKDGTADITGLLGTCVDDCLLAGNESFQVLTEQMLEKFESRPRQWDDAEFLGVTIKKLNREERTLQISQPDYISSLKLIPLDVNYERFTSIRAQSVGLLTADQTFVVLFTGPHKSLRRRSVPGKLRS